MNLMLSKRRFASSTASRKVAPIKAFSIGSSESDFVSQKERSKSNEKRKRERKQRNHLLKTFQANELHILK